MSPETASQLVRIIQEGDELAAAQAWGDLYRAYWDKLVRHLRRCGFCLHDAEDLSQMLFQSLLIGGGFRAYRRESGSVASFLHGTLKRVLADEQRRSQALKRGGQAQTISLDEVTLGHHSTPELLENDHPGAQLLRREMLDLAEQARFELRATFVAKRKVRTFDILQPYLSWDQDSPPHRVAAAKLGTTECAVRVMVSRLRGQFRRNLEGAMAS